jgi:GNAT superfamily N-acetyltransferase
VARVITYAWRGPFENAEVNGLHAAGFRHHLAPGEWWTQVNEHSLGWVCARDGGTLAGFVNVAWDGSTHAFILDTVVAPCLQRQGIGSGLVAVAAREARAAGCEWLHVDFEDELRAFYFDSCGFAPTTAGLIALVPAREGITFSD